MALLNNSFVKYSSWFIVFWLTAFLLLFPTFITFMRTTEQILSPVIVQDRFVNVVKDGLNIKFDIMLYKARECELSSLQWVGQKGEFTYNLYVENINKDRTENRSFLSKGYNYIGPFYTTLPNPEMEYLSAHLWYRCHSLYNVKEVLGPLKL